MSKFNRNGPSTRQTNPVVSVKAPQARTHGGAPAYERDAKGELFMLAISNLVGEKTFYESAGERDDRFSALVHQVALDDPKWLFSMLNWLRGESNMRSAALVGAAEMVKARIDAGVSGKDAPEEGGRSYDRMAIDAVCLRADEPGELLAYWIGKYGRPVPKPIKRGLSDAAKRLYNERNLLKYDTATSAFRFGDVLEFARPKPVGISQSRLFKYAIENRHKRTIDMVELGLPMIQANHFLRNAAARDPRALLDSDALKGAGMTWEDLLSLAGTKVSKADLWEAMVPAMGYMGLLRNLRNFDEAGISNQVVRYVGGRLEDPVQVAGSRQLPMRFLSAYRAAPSLKWGPYLEVALDACLGSIPVVKGRTLVLIDTSASMQAMMSERSKLQMWDAAVVFGLALARRCESADVVSFSDNYWNSSEGTKVFHPAKGGSLLKDIDRWSQDGYNIFGGTETAGAVRRHFADHDRVIILTDEQSTSGSDVDAAVPDNKTLITFNLAGYKRGHARSGTAHRITIGGLSDAGFKLIPILESRSKGLWPWEL
jgi:hypothetical protein